MLTYNDLYEVLRKEKYSEQLQSLPNKFMEDFRAYLSDKTNIQTEQTDLFASTSAKSKKQLENAISLFKELILRRKKKILSLVFVATETGIMKRDYENMLELEKQTFDKLTKAFAEHEKDLNHILNNKSSVKEQKNKLVIFVQDTTQFIGSEGTTIGPFKTGTLANLDANTAKILIDSQKAKLIDEE